jgi:hypothetical protein
MSKFLLAKAVALFNLLTGTLCSFVVFWVFSVVKFCSSICAVYLSFYRASAEEALQRVHGTVIGSQAVRLSWGRSPTNKQTSQDVSLLSCFTPLALDLITLAKSENICHLSLHQSCYWN